MKLRFKKPYMSIDSLSDVDLPRFVVLTGINGSGKSHLMLAIENRSVVVDGLGNPHIVRFDYESFRLANESTFNAQQLMAECEEAWQFYEQRIKAQAENWKLRVGPSYEKIREKSTTEGIPIWSVHDEALAPYKNGFTSFMSNDKWRKDRRAQGVFSLAKRIPHTIDELEREDFLKLYQPFQFANEFLPTQLGRVFWNYYIKYKENKVWAYENQTEGKSHPALTDAEFFAKHGRKPWEVVNEILASFETLTYRVNSPEPQSMFSNFQVKLEHTEKEGLEIGFDVLSSGERIMMALVASVYKAASDEFFPDLLLLDEVDASLHPSMMRNMLHVISDVFLANDVNVILVSHSPTTIALAPEESVYVMNRGESDRVLKASREEALDVLTEGFATLDQGLRLLSQVAAAQVTIISEGHNAPIIRRALELHEIEGAVVLPGIEEISGDSQLATYFRFFAKIPHNNRILFIWDCDVKGKVLAKAIEQNETFRYVLSVNEENSLVSNGIENAFPEHLFEGFITTETTPGQPDRRKFANHMKSEFAAHVCKVTKKADFKHFGGLVEKVQELLAKDLVSNYEK